MHANQPFILFTAISRKVVGRNVNATIPKGNMGYNQYSVPWHCSCRTYFCCFPLALANIRPWSLLSFFQISLKNSELKTTHNTFWGLSRALFPTTFLEKAVYITSEEKEFYQALFLSYRLRTKCSSSQFFKTNCIHSIQDHQSTRWLLAKPFKKFPKSSIRPKLLTSAKFAKKF